MKYNYLLKNKSKIVPIFFACDDKFVPYMMVTMKSLIENSSSKRTYIIHVLHTDISTKNQGLVKTLETENCKIEFNDVTKQLEQIEKKISLRAQSCRSPADRSPVDAGEPFSVCWFCPAYEFRT